MMATENDNPYGYQVVAGEKDKPDTREWVERAADSAAAKQLVNYLTPRLPQGWQAQSAWGRRDMALPEFDTKRLTEAANTPSEPEGAA